MTALGEQEPHCRGKPAQVVDTVPPAEVKWRSPVLCGAGSTHKVLVHNLYYLLARPRHARGTTFCAVS